MTRDEWLEAFAQQVGVALPSPADLDALLDVAGVAAHASERQAAPLSCYLLGRAGLDPLEGLRLARQLADPAKGEP
jgi:hypothetical protein